MNTSALRPRRPTRGGTTKAVLYCPDCGHESPPDGNWLRHDEPTRVVYDCPSCEATLTVRPKF
ncbi:hypothetical protein ACFO0N_02945 [Halobium salinum]|uniref:DUF8106 domain-containing protein n=1 Tax=Halobium salinum TaxID=1364940 RepID=A0ABD5P8S2_9EURY|nr:hypothetical protein [Halobium salinum]